MEKLRKTWLVFSACVALISGSAQAQTINDHVAEHDAQMKEEERAEREARRATYAPVVYSKYMDGGEQPDIAPAKPPVVYFDRSEEAGSIIILRNCISCTSCCQTSKPTSIRSLLAARGSPGPARKR